MRIRPVVFALAGLVIGSASLTAEVTASLNGVSMAFMTTTEPPGNSAPPSGGVRVDSKAVDRYVIDPDAGLYFGYGLVVEPLTDSRKIRISVRPLSEGVERWLREKALPGSRLISSALPRYPDPQVVQDGDTLALDLLVNPRTGVKIVDRIKISTSELGLREQAANNQPPRDYTIEKVQFRLQNYKLLVNGETAVSGGGVSGSLVGFFRPGHGTFVFSLTPRDGYPFQKVGVIAYDKLSFSLGGDTYEWISSSPILGTGGSWNVWVLFEPGSEPKGFLGAVGSRNRGTEYVIGAAGTVRAFLSSGR